LSIAVFEVRVFAQRWGFELILRVDVMTKGRVVSSEQKALVGLRPSFSAHVRA
jgi:hypothetical protein